MRNIEISMHSSLLRLAKLYLVEGRGEGREGRGKRGEKQKRERHWRSHSISNDTVTGSQARSPPIHFRVWMVNNIAYIWKTFFSKPILLAVSALTIPCLIQTRRLLYMLHCYKLYDYYTMSTCKYCSLLMHKYALVLNSSWKALVWWPKMA